jgi:hypothetical protein
MGPPADAPEDEIPTAAKSTAATKLSGIFIIFQSLVEFGQMLLYQQES